tara:strand:+ start:489 stop:788 length:300 start_codon:yes stop_codon:yes gene_type:complete
MKRFTQSLIDKDIDITRYEEKTKELLFEYHNDLLNLLDAKRTGNSNVTELYKNTAEKLSKIISLNRTTIDLSFSRAKEALIMAFEASGIKIDKEKTDEQ